MEPYFDDDDLIEDDYEDEAPPGYEDDYLEQMAMENDGPSGETATGASSNATQAANITENSSNRNLERNGASDMIESMRMEQEEPEDDDDDDEIAETSANVRQAFARRREGKKNLYTFERYVYTLDVSFVSSQ
jgi:hypothetical protein